jgi:hypothetical protein
MLVTLEPCSVQTRELNEIEVLDYSMDSYGAKKWPFCTFHSFCVFITNSIPAVVIEHMVQNSAYW